MNDITRKQMNDVIVQHNDVVRRPSAVPEPYVAPVRDDEGDRIGKNPFFEKPRKSAEPQKAKGAGNKRIIWALLFVLLLALGFVVANYFATATIEITPVTRSATLDSDITALKDASEGDLAFDTSTLVEEKTKEVPATIEKKIQNKATGKVLIYNEYNGESQRLIKNTRLETSSNKIFRIDQSVVVPAAKMSAGKVVSPGVVEVVVYADVPGDAYNIGLSDSDFTIPGFKGDPRFFKFKGRTATSSPIMYGFSGTVKVPSDETIKASQEELKQDLKKIIVEKARANIPPSKSFFPGSVVIKFEEVPQKFTAGNTAKVSMRATVSVFLFDTIKLTQKLASLSLPEEKGGPFVISNMSALDYNFIDAVDNVILSDLTKIHFHIKGAPAFVGQVDTQKIRTDLAGKNKKDFSKIIADQMNISKADAVVRPMWKTVFPGDISKITVKLLDK